MPAEKQSPTFSQPKSLLQAEGAGAPPHPAASPASTRIASAMSPGLAGRRAGACAASCCSASPIAAVPSVRVGPGLTAFTRTPLGPYSLAHALVSRLTAALLDP